MKRSAAAGMMSALVLTAGMGWAQMQSGASGQSAGTPGQTTGPQSQMDRMNNNMQAGQPSMMDKAFVTKALQGGLTEVQLGQLTLQKSENPQVKEFAQKMIDDHTRLGDQMKPIAKQLGVSVPDQPSKKDRQLIAKMQSLSGPAYDQAYVKDMVKDHKQDLNEFQAEASNGQDPTVKDAANQGSKVISQHLQMAQQLAKDQNVVASR
jgi:putative membrane protein